MKLSSLRKKGWKWAIFDYNEDGWLPVTPGYCKFCRKHVWRWWKNPGHEHCHVPNALAIEI